MLLSIKTKLKLNKSQATIMGKHAGIARFTYNWGLATWQRFQRELFSLTQDITKRILQNSRDCQDSCREKRKDPVIGIKPKSS